MEKLELNNIFTYAKNQLKDPQSCKQMILNLLTICDNNKYIVITNNSIFPPLVYTYYFIKISVVNYIYK